MVERVGLLPYSLRLGPASAVILLQPLQVPTGMAAAAIRAYRGHRLSAERVAAMLRGQAEAIVVIDILRDHEAYLPCEGSTFLGWARAEGLLD
jgi:hypothetical protein